MDWLIEAQMRLKDLGSRIEVAMNKHNIFILENDLLTEEKIIEIRETAEKNIKQKEVKRKKHKNEISKYFSASMDRASTACFTVGIAAPLVSYGLSLHPQIEENVIAITNEAPLSIWYVIMAFALATFFFHIAGRIILRGVDHGL